MGKTTVSNMFRDLGVQVWCADNEVNELYKINGAATKIFSNEFPSVVTKTGIDKKKLRCVTKLKPTRQELNEIEFAFNVCKFTKSNS